MTSGWRAVVSALDPNDTFRSKVSVYRHPLAGRPILWHVMKIYESHGVTDFIICLGYRGELIKEYFQNYALRNSDVTFDMRTGEANIHRSASEPWCVTLIDTGEKAMTGARLRKVLPFVEDDEAFCLTYGDGVANVDIEAKVGKAGSDHL